VSRPIPASSPFVKPTLDTHFHIDYEWWEREGRNLHVYLQSHLCPHHREVFEGYAGEQPIDWVDPVTAEVTRVNGVQHALRVHCSQEPTYVTEHTSLVDSVFRVFLANGNQPLTAPELAEAIGRPSDADTILRTLSGRRVYKGLRPVVADEA
jgi:hypothetical protein